MSGRDDKIREWWKSLTPARQQEVRELGEGDLPPWLYTSLARHRLAPPATGVAGADQRLALPPAVRRFVDALH